MVNEVEEGETVNINMLRSLNNTERQVDKTVTTGSTESQADIRSLAGTRTLVEPGRDPEVGLTEGQQRGVGESHVLL